MISFFAKCSFFFLAQACWHVELWWSASVFCGKNMNKSQVVLPEPASHPHYFRLRTSGEDTCLLRWCKRAVGVICSVLPPGADGGTFFLHAGHPSLPNSFINKQLHLFTGTREILPILPSPAERRTAFEKDWLLRFGAGEMNLLLFIAPTSVHRAAVLIVTSIRWMRQ